MAIRFNVTDEKTRRGAGSAREVSKVADENGERWHTR
jgi:hypothetical protein